MRAIAFGLLLMLCACADIDGDPAATTEQGLLPADAPPSESGWILHPSQFPQGHYGQNTCTFPLNPACDPIPNERHPDAGCWEHSGHDGYVRNQVHQLHCSGNPMFCGGNPVDFEIIRICQAGGAGQMTPCGPTGPAGCAVCAAVPTCH